MFQSGSTPSACAACKPNADRSAPRARSRSGRPARPGGSPPPAAHPGSRRPPWSGCRPRAGSLRHRAPDGRASAWCASSCNPSSSSRRGCHRTNNRSDQRRAPQVHAPGRNCPRSSSRRCGCPDPCASRRRRDGRTAGCRPADSRARWPRSRARSACGPAGRRHIGRCVGWRPARGRNGSGNHARRGYRSHRSQPATARRALAPYAATSASISATDIARGRCQPATLLESVELTGCHGGSPFAASGLAERTESFPWALP